MAELTHVLGAILKDVAQSRVISDAFSRDISVEYANDPILISFPVPRVEIKHASIELQFAVNAVQQKKLDTESITRDHVNRLASRLGDQVYARVIAEHPSRDQIEALLKERNDDLQGRLATRVVTTAEDSPEAVAAALRGSPETLVKKLENELESTLREDEKLWAVLRRGTLVRDLREHISAAAGPIVTEFARDTLAAAKAAGRGALVVDVAVTREELADIPETVLSHVSITTEIRNYEWTEVGTTEDGKPIRRLQPE
ncbi:MAG: hypothetical protein JXN59_09820 [Anaerolineae bacterium]|nr:hypothetical protein [Anaerolineae bacterium]